MGKQDAVVDTPVEQDSSTVAEVAAKAAATPVAATFAALRRKPRRTTTFPVTTTDEHGAELVVEMKYQGLSATEYDKLVAEHPPAPKEKAKGAVYNPDTFAPALIAAVSVQPRLTYEEAYELYHSDEWASGEMFDLFLRAQNICSSGIDVPFNGNG